MDLDAYVARTRTGPCYICAFLAGEPDYRHETVYEDDAHVAYLDRYPTLPGKVLVAPKAHIEHVVRDLDEAAYSRLMLVVRKVALAVEKSSRRSGRTCCRWAARRATATCTGTSRGCRRGCPTSGSSTTL